VCGPVTLSDGTQTELDHGHVVIAAITSCTNTSNPSVMLGAGLLARNAVQRGLRVKPWVKTSLAPGSKVVTEYLDRAGLTEPLDQLGFNLSVTPENFSHQMAWLQANGYHPIDFDDLRAYFLGQSPLPAKPVILTFDDGYRDLYTTAYPVLRAHNFKAVAYLVSGFLGAPNNVTRQQVLDMDAHGIQIGAHTYSHVDLTKTANGELTRQLGDSRSDLEHLGGHQVDEFCYPSGRFENRVMAAGQAAGYQTATTTQPGTRHAVADRFTWSRVRVSGGEGLDKFANDLSPQESTVVMNMPVQPRVPVIPRLALIYPLELPRLVLQQAAEQRPLP